MNPLPPVLLEEVKEEKPEKQAPAETPAGSLPKLLPPPDLKLKKGRNEQVVLAARLLAQKKITKAEAKKKKLEDEQGLSLCRD